MNQHSPIDRFCESPKRWLIVTAVTAVLAVATIVPLVDHYLALAASEAEKNEELSAALQTVAELPGFRTRVAQTKEKMQTLEERTLAEAGVGALRNGLIAMAREAGCQVRRINVGGLQQRDWTDEKHPLQTHLLAEAGKQKRPSGKHTNFILETRPVSLSINGSMDEIRSLLTRLDRSDMLMHAKQMELQTDARGRKTVQLELELWCFALEHGKVKT